MANNTYITEAFKKLNKMPRMHDSKKSLKESSRRGLTEADDQSSYEEYKSKVQRAYDNFDASTVTKKDALNGNISTGINHDCADYVGCLAKALDKFGIGYTIYCGVAIPNTDKVDPTDAQQMMRYRNINPNHCWLVDEYGRKREIPGYSRKVTGDEINIQKNESYRKDLEEGTEDYWKPEEYFASQLKNSLIMCIQNFAQNLDYEEIEYVLNDICEKVINDLPNIIE